MQRTQLALGLVLASLNLSYSSIVTYSFNSSAGSEVTFSPDSQPLGATVGDMARGTGLTASPASGAFSASGWTTSTTRDLNDYFTFSISPQANYEMTLTSLVLDERRSGTGIREWSVYSSLDGYSTALGTFPVPDDTLDRLDQTIIFGTAFASLSGPVSFRIYGYSSEGSTGTWRIDNVEVFGSIAAVVPEPSTWVAGALLALPFGVHGVRCLRNRKRA